MSGIESIIFFISGLLSFFIMDWMNDSMFYRQEIKACEKFKGNCDLCNCWSCHRKDYFNK